MEPNLRHGVLATLAVVGGSYLLGPHLTPTVLGAGALLVLVLGRMAALKAASKRMAEAYDAAHGREIVLREAAARLTTAPDKAEIRRVAVEAGIALGPGIDGYSVHVDILDQPSLALSPGAIPPVSGGWMAPDLVLTVPLTMESTVYGMVVASANAPLCTELAQALEALASLVTLALAGVALTEDLNRQRSESRVTALIQNSSDVVMILDSELVIRYVTPSVTRVLGYDDGRLLGRRLADIVHPDDAGKVAGLQSSGHLHPGETNRTEWRMRRGDGRWVDVESISNDLLDRPDVNGVVVTTRDVTARKALELGLKTQVEKFQELDRIKNDFVATVSHELRTPLANIIGQIEMLEDGDFGALNAQQDKVVKVIDRNSHRLLLLIEDLLTLNQIESGGLELRRVPTDLTQLLNELRREVVPAAKARMIKLSFEVSQDLGTAVVDGDQLDRALLNLLTNAIKFTSEGGSVRLRAKRAEGHLIFTVSDTGIGIPPEEQARLFTRFFRSSVATEMAIQGTGLGLVIVKTIVEEHGGTIAFESTFRQGTTATVTIPGLPAPAPAVRLHSTV